jgi:hypothetical protein
MVELIEAMAKVITHANLGLGCGQNSKITQSRRKCLKIIDINKKKSASKSALFNDIIVLLEDNCLFHNP